MTKKSSSWKLIAEVAILAILVAATTLPCVISDDGAPMPATKAAIKGWFQQNVRSAISRKDLDPDLVEAEKGKPKIIKVKKDGSGDFKTITEALKSIPQGNKKRVVVHIGGGTHNEKVTVDRTKPFVTFYGLPNDIPTIVFSGIALKYGTVDSASLIVFADYFIGANLIISNSAPRPDGIMKGAQAVALRVSGDKSAFYNCRILEFQDTLLDDKGRHFFKDCYVEGTVDFIFGNAKSIYLDSEIHGDQETMITAHARKGTNEDAGYIFLHCTITGKGGHAYLGRVWFPYSTVIFAYTKMSEAVRSEGWSNDKHPDYEKTLVYKEYKNIGVGASPDGRVKFAKQLNDAEAKPYLSLGYINASKWLLPPPSH
ncbi:LOW QUALITY PROTEIN: pectinesterase 1-like [Diospyros lotus]|uniref:LOW QUALITY PROTEIN: pectinesterase 1-like n=1 Tax=Diospyros lotus TaxID=55363 RepID=UPI00224E6592|nr:LOW QUALITY PROTEIN: pectinesterase 1-like [Diospyros lotus]